MPTGLISLGRGARRESEIASNEEKNCAQNFTFHVTYLRWPMMSSISLISCSSNNFTSYKKDIELTLIVVCVCLSEKQFKEHQYGFLRACLYQGGGPQVGEVTCGGLPQLTCKRDHIKMRDYMDRRDTPPKQVTSPIWGTPPPCKQDLTAPCLQKCANPNQKTKAKQNQNKRKTSIC